MAVTATPIFPQAIGTVGVVTTNGTSAAYTAGANGSKISGITASNTSTAADIILSLASDGASKILGTISVIANAGATNTIPSIDVLRNPQITGLPVDAFGNKVLYLAPAQVLYVKSTVTTISLIIQGADF